jgi:hypothetical protein
MATNRNSLKRVTGAGFTASCRVRWCRKQLIVMAGIKAFIGVDPSPSYIAGDAAPPWYGAELALTTVRRPRQTVRLLDVSSLHPWPAPAQTPLTEDTGTTERQGVLAGVCPRQPHSRRNPQVLIHTPNVDQLVVGRPVLQALDLVSALFLVEPDLGCSDGRA